jgi:hypothetical protein
MLATQMISIANKGKFYAKIKISPLKKRFKDYLCHKYSEKGQRKYGFSGATPIIGNYLFSFL